MQRIRGYMQESMIVINARRSYNYIKFGNIRDAKTQDIISWLQRKIDIRPRLENLK